MWGIRLTAILAALFIDSAIAQTATISSAFSVGITIGHPKAKPYRGTVSYFVPVYPKTGRRYTCAAAEVGLWRKGFRNIERLDCRGSIYRYGARRLEQRVIIRVSSRSGKILAVRR